MTLLRSIQEAAISGTDPITALLRKCKILAARLGSAEFAEWVDHELNGYENVELLPAYRIINVRSLGNFSGYFGTMLKNSPIPPACIPAELRHWASIAKLSQPIGAYEDLVRSGTTSGTFEAPWPADAVLVMGDCVYEDMTCLSAWQQIPRGAIVALLDTVRNRVLSFAIDMERLSPDAGENLVGAPTLPPDRVNQVFQTTIYGDVGNVAAGGIGTHQAIGAIVNKGDFSSLAEQLRGLGIADTDIDALKGSIATDQAEGASGLGRQARSWLGQVLAKAGEGLLKVTVETASTLLPRLLAAYLGVPG